MSNKHKWVDVIHAYAEGKPIQWRFINYDWEELPYNQNPEFNNTQIEWRVKPHKYQDVIDAYLSGETVQWLPGGDGKGWMDLAKGQSLANFDTGFKFRIKPKPDIVKTGIIYLDVANKLCWNAYNIPDNIEFTFDGETRKLKEVKLI